MKQEGDQETPTSVGALGRDIEVFGGSAIEENSPSRLCFADKEEGTSSLDVDDDDDDNDDNDEAEEDGCWDEVGENGDDEDVDEDDEDEDEGDWGCCGSAYGCDGKEEEDEDEDEAKEGSISEDESGGVSLSVDAEFG